MTPAGDSSAADEQSSPPILAATWTKLSPNTACAAASLCHRDTPRRARLKTGNEIVVSQHQDIARGLGAQALNTQIACNTETSAWECLAFSVAGHAVPFPASAMTAADRAQGPSRAPVFRKGASRRCSASPAGTGCATCKGHGRYVNNSQPNHTQHHSSTR